MKIGRFFQNLMLRYFGGKGFSQVLLKSGNSAAYSAFCEKVYGRDLCQFNMVDEAQLSKLISVLGLDATQSMLDLGCGIGRLAEYIGDTTGAKVIGIDFAKGAIKAAQDRTSATRDRIQFQFGNMNALSTSLGKFDCVTSMDTLYFVDDLDKAILDIKWLLKPHGKLAIFYTSHLKPEEIGKDVDLKSLKLGKALVNANLEFEAWDFIESEKKIWNLALSTANELKDRFSAEGNIGLYKGRIKEAQGQLKRLNTGTVIRHLYLTTNGANSDRRI